MPRLVIIGAGGFGREVLDVVHAVNDHRPADRPNAEPDAEPFDVVGFLDDGQPDPATLAPYDVAHLGPVDLLTELDPDVQYVVGVGSPQVRRQLDERFAANRTSPVLVHPSATFGVAVEFGPGTVVCAGVRLTNNIRIGRQVHLNLNSTVGHDAVLGDYVTISPQVAISGYAALADEVMVGTGVSVNPGVAIGRGAVIGSGAAVLKDIPAGAVAVGVPAKPR